MNNLLRDAQRVVEQIIDDYPALSGYVRDDGETVEVGINGLAYAGDFGPAAFALRVVDVCRKLDVFSIARIDTGGHSKVVFTLSSKPTQKPAIPGSKLSDRATLLIAAVTARHPEASRALIGTHKGIGWAPAGEELAQAITRSLEESVREAQPHLANQLDRERDRTSRLLSYLRTIASRGDTYAQQKIADEQAEEDRRP